MDGECFRVPLGFIGLSTVSHEHQAEQSSQDEHADHDHNHVRVQSTFSVVSAVALNVLRGTIRTRVLAGNIEFGVEFHQARIQRCNFGAAGVLSQLGFKIGNVSRQICDVPCKQVIVHVRWCWKFFGRHPLGGIGRLVFLAKIVHGLDRQSDVVHVSHAVGSSKAAVAIGRWNVHFLRPAGSGARHVQIVFPESIAGSRQLIAKRPRHRDDREGGCGVRQRKGGGWGLGFIGINHVDGKITGAIVRLRNIERQ